MSRRAGLGVPRHGDFPQVAVEAECLAAVIDDDEAAEAGENVGIRHGPVVDGVDGSAFGGGDVDASMPRRGRLRRCPEPLSEAPATGQSRSPRKGPIGSTAFADLAAPYPVSADCSFCCALSSSPASSAFKSRR